MSASSSPVADFARLFIRYPLRWLLPAVVVASAATAYAFLKSPTWEASLTFIVRAEANGNSVPGRFADLSAMKTFQETLLELTKGRDALAAALVAVGPPADAKIVGTWPSPRDIDDFSDAVKIASPKGTEFGSTEVFYLKVKSKTPERACALTNAIADQLQNRFADLRKRKTGSIVAEFEQAVRIARTQRDESVKTLGQFERRAGGDLSELRSLEQLGSGDGVVRKVNIELESELRNAEQAVRTLRELQALLTPALNDPTKLLATPNRLLESQPALKRLKDGLVDAQLRTSTLLGSMSPEHPLVRASIDSEQEVRRQLHGELASAVTGIQTELGPAEALVNDRRERLMTARRRMEFLASLRAEYSALNADTLSRTRQLEAAEKSLVDAQASQAGAAASSLISRVGVPDAGSKPVGPGKTIILAAGCAGGLVLGVGLMLLTVSPPVRAAAGSRNEPRSYASLAAEANADSAASAA